NCDMKHRHCRDVRGSKLESSPARERPLHPRLERASEFCLRELHWVAQDAMGAHRLGSMRHDVSRPRVEQAGMVNELPAGADTARATNLRDPAAHVQLTQELRRVCMP